MFLLFVVLGEISAFAQPATDLTYRWTARHLREQHTPVFWGSPDRSLLQQALWLERTGEPVPAPLTVLLEPELVAVASAADWTPGVALRPGGNLALGSQRPSYRFGDVEPGIFSGRLFGDVRVYSGIAEIAFRPVVGVDLGESVSLGDGAAVGEGLHVSMPEAWVGIRTQHLSAGAGLRGRWIGPGRHGSLMLTNNATPAPMLSLSAESPPLGKAGRFRMETGAGWLQAPRDDVVNPGWLMMDFRWLPVPFFELGASRVGIFGGEGRPTPAIGQLILPTKPHIYDDPEQLLPDQDELAAVDVRLMVPFAEGHSFIEGYWQYGAEDIIAQKLAGTIPYPSLAGVGNLYGVEISHNPWVLNMELTRVLDDYFRWYTGHRVYHDGLTQNGQSMAYAPGGDSTGFWTAWTWMTSDWAVQAHGERVLRVGVVESLGDNLLALGTDERRHRLGVTGWRVHGMNNSWRVDLSVEHIDGVDFVAGQQATVWRASIGR